MDATNLPDVDDALVAHHHSLVITIYLFVVLCVIISLLGLMFYSGFLDFPFEGPLPRRETI